MTTDHIVAEPDAKLPEPLTQERIDDECVERSRPIAEQLQRVFGRRESLDEEVGRLYGRIGPDGKGERP